MQADRKRTEAAKADVAELPPGAPFVYVCATFAWGKTFTGKL